MIIVIITSSPEESKMRIARWLAFPIAIILAIPVSAQPKKPKVAVTFLPMYLFTSAVVGSVGTVEILVPPGTSPHDYQVTPGNVRSISQANVLVINGLGFEEFMAGLIKNARNKNLKIIDTSRGISPLTEKEQDDREEKHEHDNDDHKSGNPHVWLDPVYAIKQVQNIRDGLMSADRDNAKAYQANAAAYLKQLMALDRQFKMRLASVQGCRFVAFHDAFPYLAKRYGLQQVTVVELPEDALTAKDIRKVKSIAQKFKVKALLSEPGGNDKRLQQIAQELRLPVKTLDPLESGQLDPQYYFTAMRQNLNTLESVCK